MQRHDKTRGRVLIPPSLPGPARSRHRLSLKAVMAILVLSSLACALFGPDSPPTPQRVVILNRLATFTPTPPLAPETSAPLPSPEEAAITAETAPTAGEISAVATEPAPGPTASPTQPGLNASPPAAMPPNTPPSSAEPVPPTDTPTALPAPTGESPPDTPTPPSANVPRPEGWVFDNIRTTIDPDGENLLLYGDVINNTGASLELQFITGTFYDAQGQVLVDGNTLDYWPIEAVPPDGQVPFELTVFGIQDAANFDLRVEAGPSREIPRQDFQFLELQAQADDDYCVTGQIRNPGSELHYYLAIVVVLYDEQGQMINFNDHYDHSPEGLVGDQTSDFEICVDPLNEAVVGHDLRAWGL